MTNLNRFASGLKPNATNPRAAAPRAETVPSRAGRAAKSTSTSGAEVAGGSGTRKVDGPGNESRFQHFAGMTLPDIAGSAPLPAAAPLHGAMKVNAMRAEVAAIGQRQVDPAAGPLYATADDAARSALRAHTRASAPKASAAPAAGTAEVVGDATLATARRLGIIK